MVHKSQPSDGKPELPGGKKAQEAHKTASPATSDAATLEERLAQARANRSLAETARQRIVTEIMEATKELYQKLVDDGEEILSRAKQREAAAALRHLEASRELEHSSSIKAEAEGYRDQVISQTQQRAQEMLRQAQTIQTEAVAFRERLLAQVRDQAQQELEQAQSERLEVDNYREKVLSEANSQAQEILKQARATAEQEGKEILRNYSAQAEQMLAEAELIKSAAQEQLEAQRLYDEVASLESESREVLQRARAELGRPVIEVEYAAGGDSAPDPTEASPVLHDSFPDEGTPHPAPGAVVDQPAPSAPTQEAPTRTRKGERLPSENGTAGPGPDHPHVPSAHLTDNDLVLGVEVDGCCRAYPLRVVTCARIINDRLNQQDLVVTFGPPSELGMVFKRTVGGRTLTFQPVLETSHDMMLMQDRETGSIWEALTGRAIEGALANAELQHLNSEYSFWFAWSELHPDTGVYSPDAMAGKHAAPDRASDGAPASSSAP